ncbi:iron-containing alcohol dehydrogenase [Endothiovibrio diazotrophicus]
MNIPAFSIARLPRIRFGAGEIAALPEEIAAFGCKVLLVIGRRSFREGAYWQRLTGGLAALGVQWELFSVEDEPSPELVDTAVAQFKGQGFECVAGIGGGSVLDAAKAIAGLLPHGNSVMDHLEGVGPEIPYHGPPLPFIAVPTTAGTGSEATKNAVLSRRGTDGFKKSFRDDDLVARVALVDPDLLASCPRGLIAANGMDAFTQLLESYVSTRANPFTDALAWSGMEAFRDGFFPVWEDAASAAEGRGRLAYASLLSGVCLAQTGLGSVHGMAPPLGSFFPIPHGVACGTLLAEAVELNIRALKARAPDSPALAKYARAGHLLSADTHTDESACEALVEDLRSWVTLLELPRLAEYGVTEADLPRIAAASRGSSMKTNPLVVSDAELIEILRRRL